MAQDLTNAVVSQKIELAPELIILQVRADGWELPEFEPGQFAVLGLPGRAPRSEGSDLEEDTPDPKRLIRRAYSIASSSLLREHMEFYINVVRSGALTPRLFALEQGDRVWLGPKVSGAFTLDQAPPTTDVVLVATGTGLAPYMSMLRTRLPRDNGRRFAVLHGVRQSWDLGYRSELTIMQQLCSNLTYLSLISRPANEHIPWSGMTGYVQDLWAGGFLDRAWGKRPKPEDTQVFLCGNPKMCEDMLALLEAEGFSEQTRKIPGQVHIERYW